MEQLTVNELVRIGLIKKRKTLREMCDDLNFNYTYIVRQLPKGKLGDGKLMLMAEYLDINRNELLNAPVTVKNG